MGTAVRGEYATSPAPPEARQRLRDIFFIQLDNLNVAIGAVSLALAPFSVDADADIVITGGASRITSAADRTTVLADPALTVSLTRTAAGRTLMSAPVPVSALLGTAQRPARWESPMLLRANSALAITVNNFQGVALAVQFTLYGYKLFNV